MTRRQVRARLKALFRYACDLGWIAKNPTVAIKPIKGEEPPTLPLEPEQYEALLAKIPEVFPDPIKAAKVRAFVRCMRYTGLAIRDTVVLTRDKIVYDAAKKITRVVTHRQKTGAHVAVPIQPDLAQELKEVADGNPNYIFWNTGTGKPESAVTNWQHDLRELFHEAGMPEGHPHQLRDTAAVERLKADVPLEEVSRLLGHSNVGITDKYYNQWVKSRQDRIDKLVMATWKDGKERGKRDG